MSDFDALYAQQQAQSRKTQHAENSTRAATFVATFLSQGDGEYIQAVPSMFNVTFVDKPIVTFGSEIVLRADPTLFSLPRSTVGVYRWVTDPPTAAPAPTPTGAYGPTLPGENTSKQKVYLGAYLYFTVDIPYLPGIASPVAPVSKVLHHVKFDGVGMKQLSEDIYNAMGL